MPIKEREQKGKAVLIDEDTAYGADRNGNGDAKVAQKRPVKRRKSESANVVLQTKRMKDLSRKKKGVRVEETTKMPSFDEPIREKFFVRFKMLSLRTQAKQHDDEGESSANAKAQLPQAQISLP